MVNYGIEVSVELVLHDYGDFELLQLFVCALGKYQESWGIFFAYNDLSRVPNRGCKDDEIIL